jgi:hypothetical protein
VSVETVSAREMFGREPVWQGTVQVFDVEGHPKATRAYAWSSPIEGSYKRVSMPFSPRRHSLGGSRGARRNHKEHRRGER